MCLSPDYPVTCLYTLSLHDAFRSDVVLVTPDAEGLAQQFVLAELDGRLQKARGERLEAARAQLDERDRDAPLEPSAGDHRGSAEQASDLQSLRNRHRDRRLVHEQR